MASGNKISVLATGLANISSVLAAFTRIGNQVELVESAAEIEKASYLVIPGVGAFGAAMARFRELALLDAVRERVLRDKPILGICLGMQLLCDSSEESPGVQGMGIFNGVVEKLSGKEKVPQLGWNKIEPSSNRGLVVEGYAYFANSYCLKIAPSDVLASTTMHGETFISAIQKNSLLACQFHPELSGAWGQELLRKWSNL